MPAASRSRGRSGATREHRLIEIDLRRNETSPSPSPALAVVLASGHRLDLAWAELEQLATHRKSLRTLLAMLEQA